MTYTLELSEVSKSNLPTANTPIYFIVDNKLYKGEYHNNGWFYSYQLLGIDVMARGPYATDGFSTGLTTIRATHWCYC